MMNQVENENNQIAVVFYCEKNRLEIRSEFLRQNVSSPAAIHSKALHINSSGGFRNFHKGGPTDGPKRGPAPVMLQ